MKHVKCVIVGDGAVGKTCLLIVYTSNQFPEDYVPTVFDNYATNINVNGQTINLQLWDTAGQEDYARLRPMSYPDTDVFLLAFSLENRVSLENITSTWEKEVKAGAPDAAIVLVGTKSDLKSECKPPITQDEIDKVVKEIGAKGYVECSAKARDNVSKVFEVAVKEALTRVVKKNAPPAAAGKDKNCNLV